MYILLPEWHVKCIHKNDHLDFCPSSILGNGLTNLCVAEKTLYPTKFNVNRFRENYIPNKKVLLHDRKKHTVCRVVNTHFHFQRGTQILAGQGGG